MQEIEKYANEYNIPIIQKEGLEVLLETIKKNDCINILEIGSAIGYSAINMALIHQDIKITTLELDSNRFVIAKDNINRFNLNNQIEIFNIDALLFETDKIFDFIFIDAAKAQYIKFFEKYKKNLSKNGVIFSDNLSFHGFVDNPSSIKSRNLKQLVRKIGNYIEFLRNNQEFTTEFIDKGDGIAISYINNK